MIPAYNAADYIAHALESVRAQTMQDFEVIVVDDGSTDNTHEVVKSILPAARYFTQSNQGAAAARNFGVAQARSELIAFLDSDDIWLPEKLMRQVQQFDRDRELAMAFTESVTFDEQGVYPNPYSKRERLMSGDLVRNIFLFSYVGTPTVMIRRDVFESVGGFDTNLRASEDDNLWIRVASTAKVILIDDVLVHVRLRSGSLTSSGSTLYDGIDAHMRLLRAKYPTLAARIGRRAFRQKKARNHYMRGYMLFDGHERRSASAYFVRSFLLQPRLSCILYVSACYMPSVVVRAARAAKRRLRSTSRR